MTFLLKNTLPFWHTTGGSVRRQLVGQKLRLGGLRAHCYARCVRAELVGLFLCVVLVVVCLSTGTLQCSMDEAGLVGICVRGPGGVHTYSTSHHCEAHLLVCLLYADRCAPFAFLFCRKNGVQIQSRVQGGSSWA